MSYLRKRGGVWYTTFDLPRHPSEPRKQKTLKLGEMSKAEAQRRERELLQQHLDERNPDVNTKTVGDLLTTWLDAMKPTEQSHIISPTTYEGYEVIVRIHLMPALGNMPLVELTPATITEAYVKIRANGTSAAMHLHVHRAFHTALTYGVRTLRWLDNNPATHVRTPKVKHPRVVIEPGVVRGVIELVKGSRLEYPLTVAALTGVRRGELLALRWSTSVDFTEGKERLVISEALEQTKMFGLRFKETKTGKHRVIPLSQRAVQILKLHKASQEAERTKWSDLYQDNDLVFCQEDGSPWKPDTLTQAFAKYSRKLGKKGFRLHDVRHTFATMTLQNGTSVKEVSELLGHSTATTTLGIYAHALEGAGRKAVNELAGLLLPPTGAENPAQEA
jgi:integrase